MNFLSSLKEFFYIELDQQTSACLYGSATTKDWVATRSDLDLFAFVPEEKIELFGKKIKIWSSNPAHPILDGFVLYQSGNISMVREFHKFENAFRLDKFIPLIDLWNIKNRSKHLFGQDMKKFVREIGKDELRNWSFEHIAKYWIPNVSDGVSRGDTSEDYKVPLSNLVWTASGIARMLMLTRGTVCSSKLEALQWLGEEYPEIRDTIKVLQEEFWKPDESAIKFTGKQTNALGGFYLQLLNNVQRF